MKTSQNNSRLGLYILAVGMAIVFAGAVWAKGNGQPVQTMEGPAIDVMDMMFTTHNLPIQNIVDPV